ncbi:grpE protein homolog 2, mitochondrial-like isoform X1 [Rhododendron vialii]|uniref:grpE protein homolog 2, mitochondrial-like isoform X1 n=1 Tax=Rhododendron vialii TaxID=182163 RepID=UPI00265F34A1|nr:grpE protein homolog 2, mitochondrial-like isoform X1 [Rhododendron vialii]
MSLYRITSGFQRTVRNSLLVYARRPIVIDSNEFHSLRHYENKVVTSVVSLSHNSPLNASVFRRLGFWSSASPETTETDAARSKNNGTHTKTSEDTTHPDKKEASSSEYIEVTNQKVESDSSSESQPAKRRRRHIKRIAFSDSDSESDLSMEDLLKVLAEKEELLKGKDKAIEMMQEKVLLADAEMANVMLRTRREAANSQKFAIQSFAKSLLDVADNLARAASVVENSFSKIDASKDTAGAVPLLKTLLEGVDMTEKQLLEVFKKSGVEKYDPTNEQFDPNRHNAAFQVPDASKPPGIIAIVLKPGFVLHDRVLRPAEVGVTVDMANQ